MVTSFVEIRAGSREIGNVGLGAQRVSRYSIFLKVSHV